MSETVRQILQGKTAELQAVDPGISVFEALMIMAEHEIGSVLVLGNGKLLGIFTERDYARKVALQGRTSRETAVAELMSPDVLTIEPDTAVETCMALMTEKRLRHLPVVENGAVTGIISIGDVVKALIADQQSTITHLNGYIAGDLDTGTRR